MNEQLPIKLEKFCQEFVTNGGNASEAYRKSHKPKSMKDKTIWEKASRIMAVGKVKTRIQELQLESNKKYEVTRDYLNETLQYVLKQSKIANKPDLDLTRKAAMDLAKLNGLIVDIGKLDVNAMVTQMSQITKGGNPVEFNV